MSNKSAPFILVIAHPEVSLGLRLDHSYGLVLELSELHICTHCPANSFIVHEAKLVCIYIITVVCVS